MFLLILKPSVRITLSKGIASSTRYGQKCAQKSRALEPPWNILFFGNDHFALDCLKPLNAKLNTNTLISALGVVTSRHTVVSKFCQDEKLPIYDWPVDAKLVKNQYDIGVVASFGKMIPKSLIEAFPLGCINVHSSILPKYRGAAPVIHAVMNGDSETGITIMKIHPHRFDVGEIVRQYRVPISPTETSVELERRLSACGAQMVMECLRDLPRCLRMAVPQPNEGVTYAPKVNSSMARVDWTKLDAVSVFNLHRALSHDYHLVTSWYGLTVKLTDVVLEKREMPVRKTFPSTNDDLQLKKSALDFLNDKKSGTSESDPSRAGSVEFVKSEYHLKVTCKDGANVIVKRLKVGGKNISAFEFFNGYMSKRKSDCKFGT